MKIDSIKVNGNECISGSLITSVDDDSELTFSRDQEKIVIVISLKTKDDKQISITSDGQSGNILKMNIELPLLEDDSQGIVRPMPIAKFDNGDQVSVQLWIRKIAKPYVVIDYSIYTKCQN